MTGFLSRAAALPLAAMLATPAPAAETMRYGYDARGRLVSVVRTGGPAPATTAYQLDKADNRTRKTVTRP